MSDNGKFILCIISVSVIIADKLSAFNKHVLKDHLSTAASVGTIKSESSRVYSTGIWKLQFTRDSPTDEDNNEKMKEN